MGLSYIREGRRPMLRSPPAARSLSQKWPVSGLFWPVFGPFSLVAKTVASGPKRQPSQHPGTPRVAQGWMGLSYSREGAAPCFARRPPLAARSLSQKWPVLACFWAVLARFWSVFACRSDGGERASSLAVRRWKWPVLSCFWAVLVSLAIFFLLVCPKMPFSVLLHARRFLVVDCLV